MAFIAGPVAGLLALLNVIPWTVGGGIGIACALGKFGCNKRDLADHVEESMPMLFQWNNTNLRGQDIAQLNEMTVSIMSLSQGEATFSNSDFSSNGSFILHDTTMGIRQGEVSFRIPGLEPPLQGTWIALDHGNAKEGTKLAFEQMHKAVKAARANDEKDMRETLVELAEMLNN